MGFDIVTTGRRGRSSRVFARWNERMMILIRNARAMYQSSMHGWEYSHSAIIAQVQKPASWRAASSSRGDESSCSARTSNVFLWTLHYSTTEPGQERRPYVAILSILPVLAAVPHVVLCPPVVQSCF